MIINKLGLHARAVAKFVQLATRFKSDTRVKIGCHQANGKSMMSLLLLAGSKGTTVTLSCEGEDEDEASRAIESLFANRFDEGE